jgi:hypothetical protein
MFHLKKTQSNPRKNTPRKRMRFFPRKEDDNRITIRSRSCLLIGSDHSISSSGIIEKQKNNPRRKNLFRSFPRNWKISKAISNVRTR